MLAETRKQLGIAFKMLVVFTVITGLVYPLVVTGLAYLLFPWQATGSLLQVDNKIIGSRLLGHYFSSPRYFWGRPSATEPLPYQAIASSGSNLGPSNPQLRSAVQARITVLQKTNPSQSIPADLVMSSASGLDPEISPRAAFYQVARVAKARGEPEEKIQALVNRFIQTRTFGILGEPRVNVLELNLALDKSSYAPAT